MRYIAIPEALFIDPGFMKSDPALILAILRELKPYKSTGEFNIKSLADVIERSPRHVANKLKFMEDHGLITKKTTGKSVMITVSDKMLQTKERYKKNETKKKDKHIKSDIPTYRDIMESGDIMVTARREGYNG